MCDRFNDKDMAICYLYSHGYIDEIEAERRAQENYAEMGRFEFVKELFAANKKLKATPR